MKEVTIVLQTDSDMTDEQWELALLYWLDDVDVTGDILTVEQEEV